MIKIDILLFDGVEVMDFAAPYEVLNLAGTKIAPGSLQVRTVGPKTPVVCRGGLQVMPAATCDPTDAPDVVILPGGPGVEPLIENDPSTLAYIASVAERASWSLAICSGSLLLAKLGLLRGRRASTHHSDLSLLRRMEPTVVVEHGKRYVRDGQVITSDGISAGLDASIFLVSQLLSLEIATQTAAWLEYHSDGWRPR